MTAGRPAIFGPLIHIGKGRLIPPTKDEIDWFAVTVLAQFDCGATDADAAVVAQMEALDTEEVESEDETDD